MQQRIFKFRAWGVNSKEYLVNGRGFTLEELLGLLDTFGWEFEQFTGLLDKNGKEIYEGDIVRSINSPTKSRNTGQVIKNGHGPAMTVAWLSNVQKNGFNVCAGDRFIIVGNIHENPELIDPVFFPPQGSVSLHEDEDTNLYDPAKDPSLEKEEQEPIPF